MCITMTTAPDKERAYMVRILAGGVQAHGVRAPYRVDAWDGRKLPDLALVHNAAYAQTVERELFPAALGSPGACLNYLRSTVDTAGQGRLFSFSPSASCLLMLGHQVCGGILVSVGAQKTALVESIAVQPEHQGGTGRALLESAMERLVNQGCTTLGLHVTRANTRARALYERCGFVECASFSAADPLG